MSKLIQQKLRRYPSRIISEGELACLFKSSPDSRYARTKRAVQAGELIRIKRGLYVLDQELTSHSLSLFELAQRVYGPSYISLESALSYHGLIPEAVYSITSTTIKRPKQFTTPLGNFSYFNLPEFNFFIDVMPINEKNHHYLIASPWKALLDYIYCYKKDYRNLLEVNEDLRLDIEMLPPINTSEMDLLNEYYQNSRIQKFTKNLKG